MFFCFMNKIVFVIGGIFGIGLVVVCVFVVEGVYVIVIVCLGKKVEVDVGFELV